MGTEHVGSGYCPEPRWGAMSGISGCRWPVKEVWDRAEEST
jgi:hypothetical protein